MASLSTLTLHGFLLFVGAELIFSLTPGPTVMLISAYGFKGGFRDALAAIAGTQTGNTLWYVICVTGLGALVTASPTLFQGIKLAGAAYLVWLGAASLWKSWRADADAHGPKLIGKPYLQATLTQMGNPKAILFFGALVPQFLDTNAPLLPQYLIMFVITFIGESIILTSYGWLAAAGGRVASTHHAVWRERVSGAVLLGLGVFAALHST
jgi:homoserine/homoserine lactone efflux protein